MKQLTIEQKAQRYDEALKRAKNTIEVNQTIPDIVECVESLFPELKESEDERIRKELIKGISKTRPNTPFLDTNVTREDAIAWLEKQGEKQQGKSALEAIKEEKVDNRNYIKPIDKVEPKFHEGEWLCENEPNNYARFIQILETVNVQGKKRYRISRDIHNDEDIVEFNFVEKYYHKFDIKGAKDGDVLATSAGAFIYNGNKGGSSCPGSYCGINTLGRFQTGVEAHWTGKKVYPATKEQRDLLFQKMREDGYEWSADKKELRKIEQNSDNKVEPMFHEGDWVVYNNDICQIVKREEGCNKLVTVFGIEKELVNERNLSTARLWTLADAKAGDILACNKEILLFKSYSVQGRISLYCWYNGQTNSFHSKGVDDALVTTRNKIWPATKEQSDTFKKVMANERYTFDFENMELRKIEQNNTDEYIETKGLFEIEAEAEELAKKQFDEQKSAWSEEDDRMMNDTLAMVDWYAGKHKNISVKVGNWLKSFKERVQPQPKSAWSEEDMAMLDSAIAFVEHSAFTTIGKGKNNVIDWLKSLKDRITLSEEQMEALEESVDAEIIEVEDNNYSMNAYTHLEISTEEDLSRICKAGDKAKVIIIGQKKR